MIKFNNAAVALATAILRDYLSGAANFFASRKAAKSELTKLTPADFKNVRANLLNLGFKSEFIDENTAELSEILRGILTTECPKLPKDHPVATYINENDAARELIAKAKELLKKRFIKNEWLEIYDKLGGFNRTHFARKQHQLYSMLENKGFDRPSRFMWSFDNKVRDGIAAARELLECGKADEFIAAQHEIYENLLDLLAREEAALYPTSLEMISEEEFRAMRRGDDEIGYFLIEKPSEFYPLNLESGSGSEANLKDANLQNGDLNEAVLNPNFLKELSNLMSKYGLNPNANSDKNAVFDVATGKLTLEQINLIYKHMPVDLSFVDENEIVKFYTDTKHRVFPRSAGVIGRDVKNCHPRESVASVLEIIDAFRKGERDEIDFWLELHGKFIYIYYVAVRDENGVFKGVLEMMQDVTRIRSLEGKRTLVTWDDLKKKYGE
nr:PAS domain-containing protein [uncultured Campylobacter sp.]